MIQYVDAVYVRRQICCRLQVSAITEDANGETHKGIANKRKIFFFPKGKGKMGESSKQVSLEDIGHVKDIDIKAQVIWLFY